MQEANMDNQVTTRMLFTYIRHPNRELQLCQARGYETCTQSERGEKKGEKRKKTAQPERQPEHAHIHAIERQDDCTTHAMRGKMTQAADVASGSGAATAAKTRKKRERKREGGEEGGQKKTRQCLAREHFVNRPHCHYTTVAARYIR